jgi:hypothetical protein
MQAGQFLPPGLMPEETLDPFSFEVKVRAYAFGWIWEQSLAPTSTDEEEVHY